MKRLLMMAFVAMELAAMTSCTKDNSELILGTWVNTADTYTQYTRNGETEMRTTPAGQTTLTFNENGTVTITSPYGVDDIIATDTFPYSVNGDTLRIDGGIPYAIKQLDTKKLILEWFSTGTWEENSQTITYVYIMHEDYDRK